MEKQFHPAPFNGCNYLYSIGLKLIRIVENDHWSSILSYFTVDFHISSTGCNLYAISRPGGSHLRLVVALGKKLLVMMWKHSSAWCAWCTNTEAETVEDFQLLRVSFVWLLWGLWLCRNMSLFGVVDTPTRQFVSIIGYRWEKTLDTHNLLALAENLTNCYPWLIKV